MPPPSPERRATGAADIAACRALLRGGSRTFYAASFLLPREIREPASALYAFCRLADDAVDLAERPADAVPRLRERLDRAYAGRPADIAADRAFADVVARHAVPRALPEALLEGFEWDLQGRRYVTLGELEAYSARVAGSVGAMMAVLMGRREPAVVARACDLGVAMQLSNIARDVGEDARAGRVYLPLEWLAEAGIDAEAWLAAPAHCEALGAVVQRLLRIADRHYERAASGVTSLPSGCRPGIHAARILYAAIGHEVERGGLDAVSRRAVVPPSRKLLLLGRVALASARLPRLDPSPPLPATRFLVDAVATSTPPLPVDGIRVGPAPWNVAARVAWVIALFERLEQREALGRTGPG